MLVLEGLTGLHRTIQLQLFSIGGWGIELHYCDVEWSAFEMNRDHSVVFEIATKYCISDSCMGFLPTVVDMMVIWIKSAYSCPF